MLERKSTRPHRVGVVAGLTLGALVGSVAFATWLANGEGQGEARAGVAQDLVVAPAVAGGELFPGGTGDVGVEITNPNPYPVLVTLVEQVPDTVITSSKAGCGPTNHAVTFSTQTPSISVPAEGSTSASLTGAVAMGLDSADACQGAVFTIQLRVSGGVDDGAVALWFLDADGDGFGTATTSTSGETAPPGYVADSTDCDDTDPNVHPGAEELPNGIDDDCDGVIDVLVTWYLDADGDAFGAPGTSVEAFDQPDGYVADNTDCDDGDPTINPGGEELYNGIDDNCDGVVDEGFALWYPDADGDGFGDPAGELIGGLTPPPGYVEDSSDCDDGDASINPGAAEVPGNGIDDNCNALVDEATG